MSPATLDYADEEFVEVVRELGGAGTNEVSEEVGCAEKTAYLRLMELADSEAIGTRKIGGVRIWFPPD